MWYINPAIQLWGLSLRRCSLSTVLCYNNTTARCKLKQTSDLHESRLFFIRKTAPRQTVRQHRVTWIRPSCNSSFNDLLCGTVAIATSWHRSLLLSYLDKSVKLRRHCHRCCCCSRADLNWISEMRFLRRPTQSLTSENLRAMSELVAKIMSFFPPKSRFLLFSPQN